MVFKDNFLADEHNLQEEKRKMVASAFGKDQSGDSATRLTVEDLNICSWSRTTPLIHSPCFSLPSISSSTRKRVLGK